MAKWKIILLVFAAAAITCDAKSVSPKQSTKTPFEFDDVVPNRFGQRGFSGTWISGKEFTYTTGGNFVKFNVETNETSTVLNSTYISAQSWSGPSFRYSSDLTKILVRYAQRQIFRHSTVSKYSIIYPNTEQSEYKIANGGDIQIAFFSPTGNGLAYIENNNINYIDFENLGLPKVITGDGIPGVVYNGIPDWVYEEEVLGTDAASWFSPDGKKLAFIRFDDKEVREAVYDIYGEGDQQYPEEVHLRYPKVLLTSAHKSSIYYTFL